jgi:hypothetical protein
MSYYAFSREKYGRFCSINIIIEQMSGNEKLVPGIQVKISSSYFTYNGLFPDILEKNMKYFIPFKYHN